MIYILKRLEKYNFPRHLEAEFASWVAKHDVISQKPMGLVFTGFTAFWVFILCPYISPAEAFSTPLNIIHSILFMTQMFWVFGDFSPWLIKHRQLLFTFGNLVVTCCYILIFNFLDPKFANFSMLVCGISFVLQALILSGCRKRNQLAFCLGGAAIYAFGSTRLPLSPGLQMPALVQLGFWVYIALLALIIGFLREYSLRESFMLNRQISQEKETSRKLLVNILPEKIIEKYSHANTMISEFHENATVLFADIVGFTELSRNLPTPEVLNILNTIFSAFDDICVKLKAEKIKTIGDAYMAASGLPLTQTEHATLMVGVALEMQAYLEAFRDNRGLNISMRVGINSGPVIAGVIGKTKICYDIWGDTVNIASRLESAATVGKILISETTMTALPKCFDWEGQQTINLKGIGDIHCGHLIERRKTNRLGA